ncbi:MAG: AbrB/MazE/SpoVT family DNA-binding domain-containing protein [Cyanobium sp.]
MRLPAAIAKEAGLRDDQTVELQVVAEGVMIRPVQRPWPGSPLVPR